MLPATMIIPIMDLQCWRMVGQEAGVGGTKCNDLCTTNHTFYVADCGEEHQGQ